MANLNYGSAAKGGLSGAAAGFSVGGPWGAVAGGTIGATAGLFDRKKKNKQLSSLDEKQQNINQAQYQSILGKGPLADLYNFDANQANDVFDQNYARPANRNFQENIVPSITGQFRGANLQNSSYAGDALSKAGRDVQEQLNGLRSKYLFDEQNQTKNAQRNAIENFQNRSNFSYDKNQGNSGFDIGELLKSIPPEAIQSLKDYFSQDEDETDTAGTAGTAGEG